jgi:hypothetical protein
MKTSKPQSVEDHPSVIAKRAEIAAVAERLRQAERREQVARARLRDLRPAAPADAAKQKVSTASKVAKLLAGGTVSSSDPVDELVASEREQAILREALSELHDQLRWLIGEISHEFSTDYLEPRVRDDTVALYGLLAEAAAVLARLRGRTATALQLGYRVSSAHCPDFVPLSAWRLGDPGDSGSELWRMRGALIARGWLK